MTQHKITILFDNNFFQIQMIAAIANMFVTPTIIPKRRILTTHARYKLEYKTTKILRTFQFKFCVNNYNSPYMFPVTRAARWKFLPTLHK